MNASPASWGRCASRAALASGLAAAAALILTRPASAAQPAPGLDDAARPAAAVGKAPAEVAATPAAGFDSGHDDDVWGIGAHPIVGYGPESSWILGVGAAIYYNTRPYDPEQRPDEYGLNLTYSLRQQGSISLDATKYLGGNENIVGASVEFTNSPGSFFGVGPDTPESAEEGYTQRAVALTLDYRRMVGPGIYVGPWYDFTYSRITEADGPLLGTGQVVGSGTTRESGVGLVASYDTTNAMLYKLRGTRMELRTGLYHAAFGSSHAFGMTEFGVSHYVPLGSRLVLALQFAARSAYGEVPFFYLPTLGSNKLLRGYSSERHIGNYFLASQAELRVPLFWRFGAVAFLGAAEVENAIADFGSTVRGAGGLGIRLALNKKQTINLRFDFAYNTDGEMKKYIRIREAF